MFPEIHPVDSSFGPFTVAILGNDLRGTFLWSLFPYLREKINFSFKTLC